MKCKEDIFVGIFEKISNKKRASPDQHEKKVDGARLVSFLIVDTHVKARSSDTKTQEKTEDFTLTVGTDMSDVTGLWILDSGSSRRLVNDLNLLEDSVDNEGVCVTAASDRATLNITKTGNVLIKVKAFGEAKVVRLLDV